MYKNSIPVLFFLNKKYPFAVQVPFVLKNYPVKEALLRQQRFKKLFKLFWFMFSRPMLLLSPKNLNRFFLIYQEQASTNFCLIKEALAFSLYKFKLKPKFKQLQGKQY